MLSKTGLRHLTRDTGRSAHWAAKYCSSYRWLVRLLLACNMNANNTISVCSRVLSRILPNAQNSGRRQKVVRIAARSCCVYGLTCTLFVTRIYV